MSDESIKRLIGKKIIAVYGLKPDKKATDQKIVNAMYVLFDDGKTYMQLTPQDPYDYHDASRSAREILVLSDKKMWKHIQDEKNSDIFAKATHLVW